MIVEMVADRSVLTFDIRAPEKIGDVSTGTHFQALRNPNNRHALASGSFRRQDQAFEESFGDRYRHERFPRADRPGPSNCRSLPHIGFLAGAASTTVYQPRQLCINSED
jgi:hypothetical protein